MDDTSLSRAIDGQYRAALAMLRRAIESCPEPLWDAREGGEAPFWQQAMHTLFYTHLYLQASERSDEAWAGAEEAMRLLGRPMRDHSAPEIERLAGSMSSLTEPDAKPSRVVTRQELLGMLGRCERSLAVAVGRVADGGALVPHPMGWMTGSALDLLLYNLRHVQHHTGRLHSLLGRHGVRRLAWVGGMPAAAAAE